MAGIVRAARLEGDRLARLGQRLLDRQERGLKVGPAAVEFDAAARNRVLRLHDHLGLALQRILDLHDAAMPILQDLIDASADARGVDPDIGAIVALQPGQDEFHLLLEVRAAQLVPLDQAEFAVRPVRRDPDDQGGIVAVGALLRIIARPDLPIADRPIGEQIDIAPVDIGIDRAALKLIKFEGAQGIVDELAAIEIGIFVGRIFVPHFGQVEKVAPLRGRILQRQHVAPDPIGAQLPGLQRVIADIDRDLVRLFATSIIGRAGP